MVKSQALRLVPISKLDCFAQAFITVSCTRSSALSCRPESETANARRLGSVASSSRLNDGVSAVMGSPAVGRGFRFLFGTVQFLQEFEEPLRNPFVLHRYVESPQLGANVRSWPKAIIRPSRPWGCKLIHLRLVSH